MSIEEYFGDWSKVIDLKEADRIMKALPKGENIICPRPQDIFKAFKLCPFNNLRVVLLGQDPYPNLKRVQGGSPSLKAPVATGLAFANSSDTPEDSYSPSLAILRDSIMRLTKPDQNAIFAPDLEKWAEQGVLLLNTALSCQTDKPASHTLLWRSFMKTLLTNLSMTTIGIVYVLMGTAAQGYETFIDHKANHILYTRHPSWYARNNIQMPSDIWRQVDQILVGINGYGIQWFEDPDYCPF